MLIAKGIESGQDKRIVDHTPDRKLRISEDLDICTSRRRIDEPLELCTGAA